MLVVIVAEPKNGADTHGVAQRVQAIDAWCSRFSRFIVFVSLRRNLMLRWKSGPGITSIHLNALLHGPLLWYMAFRANAIYIHTCLAAIRVFVLLAFRRKLILDLHGLFPEEFVMMRGVKPGAPAHRVCELIERVTVKRAAALIVVSDAMREHFQRKYPSLKARVFTIPIFPERVREEKTVARELDLAVYSGGLQKWQCIGRMIELAAAQSTRFRFLFLSGEAETLKEIAQEKGLRNVEIRRARKEELSFLYSRATYGFVLRCSSPVNMVACPTKLVEYLECGVVPVVHEKRIGDFMAAGYQFIVDEDFAAGKLPDAQGLEQMRVTNKRIVQEIVNKGEHSFAELIRFFHLLP